MYRSKLATVVFLAVGLAMIAGIPAIGIDAQQGGVFYPNIPGELLLENEHVVVQRFIIEPGQWEGIHSHPGNQIAVRIKGGLWAGRRVAARCPGGLSLRRMALSDGWRPSTCPSSTSPATSEMHQSTSSGSL